MLGKNNFDERVRKMEKQSQKDRFSIRKLSIGAASVLIGLTFAGMNSQTAKADTVNSGDQTSEQTNVNISDKAANSVDSTTATQTEKKDSSKDLSSFSGLNSFLKSTKNTQSDNSKDSENSQSEGAVKPASTDNAATPSTQADEILNSNVATSDAFVASFESDTVKKITLVNDVDVPNNAKHSVVNLLGQIGTKTDKVIDGQGHTLKLNGNKLVGNLSLNNILPNITFENITIESDPAGMTALPVVSDALSWYTLSSFKNVKLDNVTTNNVNFYNTVEAAGNTTINYDGARLSNYGRTNTLFCGNLTIDKGANVKIDASNLVQVFDGSIAGTVENVLPAGFDWSNILGSVKDAIKNLKFGAKVDLGTNSTLKMRVNSNVYRLSDGTLLNFVSNAGSTLDLQDDTDPDRVGIFDATANQIFLTADNPDMVRIWTANPDVKRPQVRVLGTNITGKNIGMSDPLEGANWTFNAKDTNLAALVPSNIVGDIITAIIPGWNISGLNESLASDYKTPADQIAANGYTDKTYVSPSTLEKLKNYFSYVNGPLNDATQLPIIGGAINTIINDVPVIGDVIGDIFVSPTAPEIVFGTNLDKVLLKTEAGRYNVSGVKQTVGKDELTLDASASDVINVTDSASGKLVGGTNALVDKNGKKIVTGVAWINGARMKSDGTIVHSGGAITTSTGRVDKSAAVTAVDELGNAVAVVSYADGTTDTVPVQIEFEKAGTPTTPTKPGDGDNTTKPGDNDTNKPDNGNKPAPTPSPAPAPSTPVTGNTNSPITPAAPVTPKNMTLYHNAKIYDNAGNATDTVLKAGATLTTYGSQEIAGRKYYSISEKNDKFVVASNIDGKSRKLRHKARVYKKSGKKTKKVYKKNKSLKTYGGAVKLHGKKYYIISIGKYVKKVNFR